MVIFLIGLVSMILMRTLRNDYAKYAREDDDLESLVMCNIEFGKLLQWSYIRAIEVFHFQERGVSEESSWKLVHGDVFRTPRNLVLLSAVVGTGAQLALLILLVILFAIFATLYIGYIIFMHHMIWHNRLWCVSLWTGIDVLMGQKLKLVAPFETLLIPCLCKRHEYPLHHHCWKWP